MLFSSFLCKRLQMKTKVSSNVLKSWSCRWIHWNEGKVLIRVKVGSGKRSGHPEASSCFLFKIFTSDWSFRSFKISFQETWKQISDFLGSFEHFQFEFFWWTFNTITRSFLFTSFDFKDIIRYFSFSDPHPISAPAPTLFLKVSSWTFFLFLH